VTVPPPQQEGLELEVLLSLVSQLTLPLTVLEIGVYEGGTLWHWLQLANRVVAVDDTMRSPGPARWKAWAARAKCDLVLLQGSSHDPAIIEQVRALGPYGFCLIDADHTYEAVKQDWDNYRDMIEPNGIVAFHDILPRPAYGVDRLWAEVKAEARPTIEVVADATSARCGIGVVWP
jgi:cephalosporin hydroxylase